MEYHKKSGYRKIKMMQVNQREIWWCDLGFNIGEEKNKERPVIVLSKNNVNKTGKIIVAPITDANGKMDIKKNRPFHDTWHLLYCNTTNSDNMYAPGRRLSKSAITYPCLTKDSIIQVEELRSVSKARLLRKEDMLDFEEFNILKKKIKNVFDIIQ